MIHQSRLLVGELHHPLREDVALGFDVLLADQRREVVACHQQREIEVAGDRGEVEGVVTLVDGVLAFDEVAAFERFGDPAALPGVDVEFLPEVALVDAARRADEFETGELVLREFLLICWCSYGANAVG